MSDALVGEFVSSGLLLCGDFTADTTVAFSATRGFDLARQVMDQVARFPRGAERLVDNRLYRQICSLVQAAPVLAEYWNRIAPLQEAIRPGLGTIRYSLAECMAISEVTAQLSSLLHRIQRLELA